MKQLFSPFIILILSSITINAQDYSKYFKGTDINVLFVDDAVYSESTAITELSNDNLLLGGFYRSPDGNRKSCIFLLDKSGKTLNNAYETNFLAYTLYEEEDNFITDIIPIKSGGAYVLGNTALSHYYTGYLSRLSNDAEIDESFMIAESDDTGFVRVHSYKMTYPNSETNFRTINDTIYSEAIKLLQQKDGKLIMVGKSRQQNTEDEYEDGASFVVRLNTDGSIDKTYGIEGFAYVNISDNCDDVSTAILDDDDNVILFGKYNHKYTIGITTNVQELFVVKVNKDGTISRHFGNNGRYIFAENNSTFNPVKIIKDTDGGFLFFSNQTIKRTTIDSFSYGYCIFKLNNEGKIVRQFHNNGVQNLHNIGIGFVTDIQRMEDGKLLICGTNQNLVNESFKGKTELLYANFEEADTKIYSNEELNAQRAIGFTAMLHSDCTVDSTFPKNGIHLTSWKDKTQKMYFSLIFPLSVSEIIKFGAGESDDYGDKVGFLIHRVLLDLKLGEVACKKDMGLQYYPNPIRDFANVEFELCVPEVVSAQLYSVDGKKVQSFFEQKPLEKGAHQLRLDINQNLTSGVYIFVLSGKDFSKSIKVVLSK